MSSSVTSVLQGSVQRNDRTINPITIAQSQLGNESWGDIRRHGVDECIRIGFWNCGGLPATNTDPKNAMIRDWILHHQFNIVGLSECNIHWKKMRADQRLPERTLGWFESIHLSLAYHLDWLPQTTYQVGGVLLWSINNTAHRVIKSGSDSSNMGRWCWTTYRGRNNTSLRVISAYRCVVNTTGPQSAWSQQTLALEHRNIASDPRDLFISDIFSALEEWIALGDQIVLGLDLNENIMSSPFTNRLLSLGLIELNSTKHGQPPPSYIRGSTTIDGLYVSPALSTCECGFLPFLGDHRPSWIDIPFSSIFGHISIPPPKARRLKLQDPRTVSKYTSDLAKYVAQHHLIHRAEQLSARLDWENLSFLEEYNEIDLLRTKGMKHAEKHCRKLRMGSTPYSLEYSKVSLLVLVWRLIVKLKSGKSIDSRYFNRQLKRANLDKQNVMAMTIDESRLQLQTMYRSLNSFSKDALHKRSTWLEELACARADTNGLSAEQELRNLIHREHQRRNARMIKYTTRPSSLLGLSLLQVPIDNDVVEITKKEDMESHLFAELAARFHQAKHTPFATPLLLSLVGPLGDTEAAQQILEGTFICPPEIDHWTQKLVPHLANIPNISNARQEFNLVLTTSEHAHGWKKMKEKTSPGLSALSFAQFKAATTSPELCHLDTIMATIPYQSGISPLRWQQGLDIMLQKQQGNFQVEKLRAILLFESDFNQNNKRFGRQLMYIAEKYNAMAMEQFGSRKNMSAIDQSLNKALTFDIWRQGRMPGALCSNDAKSCYDRIVHNFASLCLQRLGAPIAPIISMFSTIQQLNHHIRTVHGDSATSFSGKHWNVPIHGVGQGNGAGPQIWAAVSTPLLNLLRSERCGSYLCSSISGEQLHFVGYAFVDDTDLVSSHYLNTSGRTVIHDLQRSVNAWQGGINASGGALVPEKSHWYFVDFKWNQGKPSYKTIQETPAGITIRGINGQIQPLRQLQPWEAERTLGVRLAPDGNMKSQAIYMRQTAEKWSDAIRSGHLPRHLIWQAMHTTILKTMSYPLPATTLTESQCDHIMAPILQACLPRSGIVRTFPRSLAYASHQHLGLDIPNLYWLQGYYHIDRLLRFANSSHLTGRLLRQSCEFLRLELGCNGSLFAIPFTLFGHLPTESWLTHTWKFLCESNIQLDISVPELPLLRELDGLLIPTFVSKGFSEVELHQLNRCRIYLKAVSLSDIVSGCGRYLLQSSLEGKLEPTRKQSYVWPYQAPLPTQYWDTWKKAMTKLCNQGRLLHQPLGRWLKSQSTDYTYDPVSDRIYFTEHDQLYYFPKSIGRASRSAVAKFSPRIPCRSIPSSARPATVEYHRSFLCLTGWADTVPQVTTSVQSFFEYIQLHSPISAKWALDNLTYVGNLNSWQNLAHQSYINVVAVSDGSFKESHGTASWRISLRGKEDYFLGSVIVPGSPVCQSAYRSELAGIYGICISLLTIQKHYGCLIFAEIGCDGLSALQTCQDSSDTINPNIAHFDLIYAIRFLTREIKGGLSWRHIKGHQDDNRSAVLDIWAQYNIQMDSAAKEFWSSTSSIEINARPNRIYGEPGIVWIHESKISINLKDTIFQHLGSIKAVPKWERHFHWEEGEGRRIHWQILGLAVKRVKLSRQIWITKTTSGFYGSGIMMQRWKFRTNAACPRCGFLSEDTSHIFQCPHPEARAIWQTKLEALHPWLIQNYTSPSVASVICGRLNSWITNSALSPISSTLSPPFRPVIGIQDAIGWNCFFQGFWALEWEGAQSAYLQSIKSRRSPKRWLTSVITKLWDIAWDMWEHRNGCLHDNEMGEEIIQLHSDITHQYSLGSTNFSRKSQGLFHSSLESLLLSSKATKQLWLQRVISARLRVQHQQIAGHATYNRERQTMRTWLQPQR